jgi:hypothetical protein
MASRRGRVVRCEPGRATPVVVAIGVGACDHAPAVPKSIPALQGEEATSQKATARAAIAGAVGGLGKTVAQRSQSEGLLDASRRRGLRGNAETVQR